MTARRQPPTGPGGLRGSALIVVMWACFSLVSLALVCGQSQLLAYRGTDNRVAAGQARQAIEGAARYAEYVLANLETPGQLPAAGEYACTVMEIGDAQAWFIGRAEDTAQSQTVPFGLIDEASKLNLNTATAAMLALLPRMTPELAAAIVDWRDTDENVTEGGAESETYLLKSPAYNCKNAPFESVEELLLVSGVDETLLYGEDANRNGLLDPNENDGDRSPPDDNANGVLEPGLAEYVTVYSSERNVQQDGSARVNVNRSLPQVGTTLGTALGASRAQEIVQRLRAGGASYRSLLDVYLRSGMTPQEFAKVSDALTVTDETVIKGRINVNTAPAAVLACVPGLDATTAASLVTYRQSRKSTTGDIGWVTEVLKADAVAAAGPYLTGRSSQATADIAAVGRHGRGYQRTLFVIDFSGSAPACLYRRDMDAFGWALGDTAAGDRTAREVASW